MNLNKRVAFLTLGCKLNFSETSTLARQFQDNGFERVSAKEEADIYVVNTCSVTDHSDKKCRNVIRKVSREHPNSILVVTGCYAQLKAEEISSIEGVDLVVGNGKKGEIVDLVKKMALTGKAIVHTCETEQLSSFFVAFSSGDRTRTFLKVQDGCSYKCSYCTIPLARGESRNIPISSIVEQANQIAEKSIKEIVITGVNVGDFGRSTGETFFELIKELNNVIGIERYRISSIEPNLLTEEIIDFIVESPKFQPHFHIPLQAGSDNVLSLMRRRYNTSAFISKIKLLKDKIKGVFIGIDVIVGFPGETDDDFESTYNILKDLEVSFIHVFPYSERANTPAIEFENKVSAQIKDQRVRRLTQLSDELHKKFVSRFVGTTQKVLVEGFKKGGLMFGYTSNYIKIEIPYKKELIGKIVTVSLSKINDDLTVSGDII